MERSCSNYGFANATDLTCCGGRLEAVRKEPLAAENPNLVRVLSGDDA